MSGRFAVIRYKVSRYKHQGYGFTGKCTENTKSIKIIWLCKSKRVDAFFPFSLFAFFLPCPLFYLSRTVNSFWRSISPMGKTGRQRCGHFARDSLMMAPSPKTPHGGCFSGSRRPAEPTGHSLKKI